MEDSKNDILLVLCLPWLSSIVSPPESLRIHFERINARSNLLSMLSTLSVPSGDVHVFLEDIKLVSFEADLKSSSLLAWCHLREPWSPHISEFRYNIFMWCLEQKESNELQATCWTHFHEILRLCDNSVQARNPIWPHQWYMPGLKQSNTVKVF
jgi:hypothetical protein